MLMLAHRGNKAYGEGFDLVHRREALKPNSIWQVDHAQLDIKLLRDDGSVGKPWLTIVIDDYSRAVAGYYLGFEPPSSLRTTLACVRVSGVKVIPTGRSAAFQMFSTPTTDLIFDRSIWNRWRLI
jgi:transposase InsO family protein